MSYSHLNHADTEFLADEEAIGEEAEDVMQSFFQKWPGTKSKAFLGDELRYIITEQQGDPEIIEEDGEWQYGIFEAREENDYELIYTEDGEMEREEISASEAAEYFEAANL